MESGSLKMAFGPWKNDPGTKAFEIGSCQHLTRRHLQLPSAIHELVQKTSICIPWNNGRTAFPSPEHRLSLTQVQSRSLRGTMAGENTPFQGYSAPTAVPQLASAVTREPSS